MAPFFLVMCISVLVSHDCTAWPWRCFGQSGGGDGLALTRIWICIIDSCLKRNLVVIDKMKRALFESCV